MLIRASDGYCTSYFTTKRTTGATDGPKSLKGFSLAIALPCDASLLHADWLAAAGLMLALHWPSGPWPLDAGLWTLVPSDAGCHRHWSLSALVVLGSGRCEKTRSINR
jgi:hypothetical protein